MRTISLRLDDRTDAMLRTLCAQRGVNQTDALKAAIVHLAAGDLATPATLARELGLVGAFRSTEGDLASNHSAQVKARLRAKFEQSQAPATRSQPD